MPKFRVEIDVHSTDRATVEVEADDQEAAIGLVDAMIAEDTVEQHIVAGGDDPATTYAVDFRSGATRVA